MCVEPQRALQLQSGPGSLSAWPLPGTLRLARVAAAPGPSAARASVARAHACPPRAPVSSTAPESFHTRFTYLRLAQSERLFLRQCGLWMRCVLRAYWLQSCSASRPVLKMTKRMAFCPSAAPFDQDSIVDLCEAQWI